MRKTRLVILPTKCLHQMGFLLLFLSCPVIGDWGRIRPESENAHIAIRRAKDDTCGLESDPSGGLFNLLKENLSDQCLKDSNLERYTLKPMLLADTGLRENLIRFDRRNNAKQQLKARQTRTFDNERQNSNQQRRILHNLRKNDKDYNRMSSDNRRVIQNVNKQRNASSNNIRSRRLSLAKVRALENADFQNNALTKLSMRLHRNQAESLGKNIRNKFSLSEDKNDNVLRKPNERITNPGNDRYGRTQLQIDDIRRQNDRRTSEKIERRQVIRREASVRRTNEEQYDRRASERIERRQVISRETSERRTNEEQNDRRASERIERRQVIRREASVRRANEKQNDRRASEKIERRQVIRREASERRTNEESIRKEYFRQPDRRNRHHENIKNQMLNEEKLLPIKSESIQRDDEGIRRRSSAESTELKSRRILQNKNAEEMNLRRNNKSTMGERTTEYVRNARRLLPNTSMLQNNRRDSRGNRNIERITDKIIVPSAFLSHKTTIERSIRTNEGDTRRNIISIDRISNKINGMKKENMEFKQVNEYLTFKKNENFMNNLLQWTNVNEYNIPKVKDWIGNCFIGAAAYYFTSRQVKSI